MAKVFEVNYYKGQIFDSVSSIQPTIRGSMPLIRIEKGLSCYSFSTSNSFQFSKSLSGTYSVVVFGKFRDYGTNGQIADFRTASGTGLFGTSTGTNNWSASSGTLYTDGIQTTVYKQGKITCFISSGMTISCTVIELLNNYVHGAYANGYMLYFAIYSGTLTQSEINQIQKQLQTLQPIQPPKKNIIKESNRSQINFDLNITSNNYVEVPDSNSIDFGTGSFSVYWEDTYPQIQSNGYGVILGRDSGASGSWIIAHNSTTTNGLAYVERGTGLIQTLISSGISNGQHKFLFVRNITTSKNELYIDGALVYSQTPAVVNNLTTTIPFRVKMGNPGIWKTSGDIRNVRMWNTVKTWSQAVNNNKTNQVLDLPMNEGQGLTVYDKSGNGNNGTITSTTGKPWKKIQVKSDIVFKEDFSYDKADGTNVVPVGRIKGTGSHKLVTETTGNSIINKGTNYIQSTAVGPVFYPIKRLYGTLEFSLYKGADGTIPIVGLMQVFGAAFTAANTGYRFAITNVEGVTFRKNVGGVTTNLYNTANSYISNFTRYRFKITRTITGTTTLYIKGGSFGNNYVLISSVNIGSNPHTDNTITSVNYLAIDSQSTFGDRFANIVINSSIV